MESQMGPLNQALCMERPLAHNEVLCLSLVVRSTASQNTTATWSYSKPPADERPISDPGFKKKMIL